MWKHEPDKDRWYERWALIALFALWAVAPGWAYAYALPSGTGDVLFTLSDGGNLILAEGNPRETNSRDFNVAPGVEITSARDIDVTAPNPNAHENAFNETQDLILNGGVLGGDTGISPPPEDPTDSGSIQEGVLNGFILQFFDNALTGC